MQAQYGTVRFQAIPNVWVSVPLVLVFQVLCVHYRESAWCSHHADPAAWYLPLMQSESYCTKHSSLKTAQP